MIPPNLSSDLAYRAVNNQPVFIEEGLIVNQVAAPVVTVPVNTAQVVTSTPNSVSNSTSILNVIPRSVYLPLTIIGTISAIGYISYKYCPWWRDRLYKKRKVKQVDQTGEAFASGT